MRLFQIEEPDGRSGDPETPGAAVGIDASGAAAEVAMAVGGNAVLLADREGFESALPVPNPCAGATSWQALFEGVRLRAERALSRPVTHAVVALARRPDPTAAAAIMAGADAAGMTVLRLAAAPDLDIAAGGLALAAAILAEDLAPRPEPEPR